MNLFLGLNRCTLRYFSTSVVKRSATAPQDTKKLLMELRKVTGYPLISCRQALVKCDYDFEKAQEHLTEMAKEKGWSKMQDASRTMPAGLISLMVHKKIAVCIEVNCETDFVAKTEQFQTIVKELTEATVEEQQPKNIVDQFTQEHLDVENLMKLPYPGKKATTFHDAFALAVGKLKERVQVRRAIVLKAPESHHIGSYVHPSLLPKQSRPGSTLGTYAAAVVFQHDNPSVSPQTIKLRGRDIAQHVVGMKPRKVGIPPKIVTQEIEGDDGVMTSQQVMHPNSNSKELLKQPWLLESSQSVAEYLQSQQIKVDSFLRLQVAEDLPEGQEQKS